MSSIATRLAAPLLWLLLAPMLCVDLYAQPQPDGSDLTPVTLQLRWHHQFQFAGYYVAQKMGYYREAGLDVNFIEGDPGVRPIEEVSQGRAHFGIENSGLLKARADGEPVKALAAIFQKSAMRLIVMADEPAYGLETLRGKRVMLEPGYGSLALVAMLQQAGLDDDIERVNSSHKIEDLIVGETFAFNGYISNEPYQLEQTGLPFHVYDPADYGIEFYSDVLFTRDDLVADEPDMVEAFRSASLRGWEFALEHPDQAITITREFAPDKTLAHLQYEANRVREQIMPDLVQIGHMNRLRWEKIQRQLVAIGHLNKPIDINEFVADLNGNHWHWHDLRPYAMMTGFVVIILALFSAFHALRSARLQQQVVQSQEAEKQAYQLATHDSLTGLPNRLLLLDLLGGAIRRAQRDDAYLMISFIDLDNFKLANDELGHAAGDRLLQEITRSVESVKREADAFARIGGDEFVMVSEEVRHDEPEQIGRRILDAIRGASAEFHTSTQITASIGMVLVAQNTPVDAEKLLKLADIVMYEVKRLSKNAILVKRFSQREELETYTIHPVSAA